MKRFALVLLIFGLTFAIFPAYGSMIDFGSPLEQFKAGTKAQDIHCESGLPIIKEQNGHPACVSADHVSSLVLRGWAHNPLPEILNNFGDKAKMNRLFYDIMNEPRLRDWSSTGWRYNYANYASGEHDESHMAVSLFLPGGEGNPKINCDYIRLATVTVNLKTLKIEDVILPICVNPDVVQHMNQDPDYTMSKKDNAADLNHFPGISHREMTMTLTKTAASKGLLVTVTDTILRERPSDTVMLQQLVADWNPRKYSDQNFLMITNEKNQTDVAKPFLIQESLLGMYAGSLHEQINYTNPIDVPLREYAKNSTIIIKYSMPDMLPDSNNNYHLVFSSFSNVEIRLPENTLVLRDDTRTHSEFWKYDYDAHDFVEKSDSIPIGFQSDEPRVKKVKVYDIVFKVI